MAQDLQSQLNAAASTLTLLQLRLLPCEGGNSTALEPIRGDEKILSLLAEISLSCSDIFEQLNMREGVLSDWQQEKLQELVDGCLGVVFGE